MHKVLRSAAKFKINWNIVLLLLVVVGVVLLVKPLRSLFDGFNGLIGSMMSGLNSGAKSLNDWLGLNEKNSGEVKDILSPGLTDPWNPNYYKQYQNATLITVASAERLADRVTDAVDWWSGVDMGKLTGVFAEFKNKAAFSFFNEIFLRRKGALLSAWLVDGWMGGLVASVGDSDMVKLKHIIDQLPAY